MIWLTAVACLVIGLVVGALFASRSNASPARVKELENQIRYLKDKHNNYRDDVSDHFSMTAELVQHMTESYKEVYQHLATGAQSLCSNEVANRLLPASSESVFESNGSNDDSEFRGLNPPKDYAAKQSPRQKGALAEDFGLDKSKSSVDEDNSAQQTH